MFDVLDVPIGPHSKPQHEESEHLPDILYFHERRLGRRPVYHLDLRRPVLGQDIENDKEKELHERRLLVGCLRTGLILFEALRWGMNIPPLCGKGNCIIHGLRKIRNT